MRASVLPLLVAAASQLRTVGQAISVSLDADRRDAAAAAVPVGSGLAGTPPKATSKPTMAHPVRQRVKEHSLVRPAPVRSGNDHRSWPPAGCSLPLVPHPGLRTSLRPL